jgi:hypothetical protein
MKRLSPPIVLWEMFGAALAWITSHVADWFVMTDELLYERLASSVDRLHSPIPHVHGVVVANLNQLYPLMLAPVFATGAVADGLHRAGNPRTELTAAEPRLGGVQISRIYLSGQIGPDS